MKIKTAALLGPALDWAVASIELGDNIRYVSTKYGRVFLHDPGDHKVDLKYSTNWSQGGPIIEREGIEIKRGLVKPFVWAAFAFQAPAAHCCGPTPLIAAMRCFVASKLGDEVDVPNELLK